MDSIPSGPRGYNYSTKARNSAISTSPSPAARAGEQVSQEKTRKLTQGVRLLNKVQQRLLPTMQKRCPRTGYTSCHFPVTCYALLAYTRIVFPYDASRRFNLRVWRGACFIIAGQRDSNAAGVHRPVSSVPAYRRVFQQAFSFSIGS